MHMATGFIYSDRFLEHDTGPMHPERPERLRAITDRLERGGLSSRLTRLEFSPADRRSIERLHDPSYVQRVFEHCRDGRPYIDSPDSVICETSAELAQLAVGGGIAAARAVMRGEIANAFCAVRPPGHHAERGRAMGFCLFNTIAITAEYLISEHQLDRVAIVDFDVHHGNGTQDLFESRSDVLFISIHEDPDHLYPGSGYAEERGSGEGEGFTLNLPMPPGSGDDEYDEVMRTHVLPAIEKDKPEFLLISAGFDAAAADPLAHMLVTSDGFERITQRLIDAAGTLCDGRVVSMLEGGYDLDALADGVERHVRVLMNAGWYWSSLK